MQPSSDGYEVDARLCARHRDKTDDLRLGKSDWNSFVTSNWIDLHCYFDAVLT
jgi:hypothetical protein